jgi:hypothetical protein
MNGVFGVYGLRINISTLNNNNHTTTNKQLSINNYLPTQHHHQQQQPHLYNNNLNCTTNITDLGGCIPVRFTTTNMAFNEAAYTPDCLLG